jgi:hypothetical protein
MEPDSRFQKLGRGAAEIRCTRVGAALEGLTQVITYGITTEII